MSRLGDQSHQVANTDNGVLELSASVGFPLTEHVENHLLACRELAACWENCASAGILSRSQGFQFQEFVSGRGFLVVLVFLVLVQLHVSTARVCLLVTVGNSDVLDLTVAIGRWSWTSWGGLVARKSKWTRS